MAIINLLNYVDDKRREENLGSEALGSLTR